MTKRVFDIIISLLALLALSPLLALVTLIIKIESKGPAIFKQERVGLYGHGFIMYKLRSMNKNADTQGPHFTKKGDPRITRIGQIIRKTSIDELPQLFNVLIGDMSLVGPRPNVFKQEAEYTKDDWDKRNTVKPGITGLAQAKLRSTATETQRTDMDLQYIEKASFIFDLKIIILTIKRLIIGGAN